MRIAIYIVACFFSFPVFADVIHADIFGDGDAPCCCKVGPDAPSAQLKHHAYFFIGEVNATAKSVTVVKSFKGPAKGTEFRVSLPSDDCDANDGWGRSKLWIVMANPLSEKVLATPGQCNSKIVSVSDVLSKSAALKKLDEKYNALRKAELEREKHRKLSKRDVTVPLRAAQPKIDQCATSTNANRLGGTIRIKFKILKSGKTSHVRIVSKQFVGTDVGKCVSNVISNVTFRPTQSKKAVPVTYPFVINVAKP